MQDLANLIKAKNTQLRADLGAHMSRMEDGQEHMMKKQQEVDERQTITESKLADAAGKIETMAMMNMDKLQSAVGEIAARPLGDAGPQLQRLAGQVEALEKQGEGGAGAASTSADKDVLVMCGFWHDNKSSEVMDITKQALDGYVDWRETEIWTPARLCSMAKIRALKGEAQSNALARHLWQSFPEVATRNGLHKLWVAPERSQAEAQAARPILRAAWVAHTAFSAAGAAGEPRTGRVYSAADEILAQRDETGRIVLTHQGRQLLGATEEAWHSAIAAATA